MPTAATAAARTDALIVTFRGIGKEDGSAMPRWTGDKAKQPAGEAAWEYHVSTQLAKIATKRRDDAIKAAVKAGVMFDHEKDPQPAGTQRVVYSGPIVEISVKVGESGRVGIDFPAFVDSLVKAKVDPRLIERLRVKHRTETRPSHEFRSSLVTTR